MKVNVRALGGIGEYGRNCYLIEVKEKGVRFLLDCGVANGNPEKYPDITEELAQSVQMVFISHTHNDHIGALPLLIKQGFTGDIWLSEASDKQLQEMIQHNKGKWQDLSFTSCNRRILAEEDRGKRLQITEDMVIVWGYSGHMLGSIWLEIYMGNQSIFYSGDIVLESPLLVTDLPNQDHVFDVALIDSGHAAQVAPYQQSVAHILEKLGNPRQSYFFKAAIGGKICDLLYTLYILLPNRTFYLDEQLYEHVQSYLRYPSQLQPCVRDSLIKMLTDAHVKICTEAAGEGIYFTMEPIDAGQVPIDIANPEQMCFYKAHPDLLDLKWLITQIHAKEYILFHSEQKDLEKIKEELEKNFLRLIY